MGIKESWIIAAKAVVLGGMGGVFVLGELVKGLSKTENDLFAKVYQGEEAKMKLKNQGLYKEDLEKVKADEMAHHAKTIRDNILAHLFCDDSNHFIINGDDLEYAAQTAEHFGYELTKLYEGDILPENKNCFLIRKFTQEREIEYQRYLLFNIKKQGDKFKPILAIKNPAN